LYYGDGSKEAFTKRGTYTWYMTERDDPARNKLSFVYTGLNTLDQITDADGNTAYFYRTNTRWPTRITKISAPGSRDVNLFYDTSGRLTNITDVEGIVSTITSDDTTKARYVLRV
jgi:YD repeat-containing protein